MGSRIVAVLLSVLTLMVLAGCGESYTEYGGIVQSVDLENQIIYVVSDGEDSLFQNPCAVDCRAAVQHDSVMLLDADSASLNLSSMDLADIMAGDTVDVFLSDTEAREFDSRRKKKFAVSPCGAYFFALLSLLLC